MRSNTHWYRGWWWSALFLLFAVMPITAAEPGQFPNIAPGVLTTVPPLVEERDTASPPVTLAEIESAAPRWEPHESATTETLQQMARNVVMRRPVWQLEFAYKPLRMITIPSGGNARQVWYLVYRVRNTGGHAAPVPEKDEYGHDRYELRRANIKLRLFPTMRLRDHETGRELLDQVIPDATPTIHASEIRDPAIPLYDSVQITRVPLELSSDAVDRGVWGVATWEGVDRRADFLSVYVQGLTNAFRWDPTAEGQRQLTYKTVQLNFWRPGDDVDEHVGEFHNGLPGFSGPALKRALEDLRVARTGAVFLDVSTLKRVAVPVPKRYPINLCALSLSKASAVSTLRIGVAALARVRQFHGLATVAIPTLWFHKALGLMVALEKGVRNQECEAPDGPFRLSATDPFFGAQTAIHRGY